MYKFEKGNKWRKKLYVTEVSEGEGVAEKEAIENALKDFEKKHHDLEVEDWYVLARLKTNPEDEDCLQVFADQYLHIKAKKRRPIKIKAHKKAPRKPK